MPGFHWATDSARARILALNEFSAAAADLSRAIAFDPSNAEYYLSRGKAYMHSKNPEAAMRDFSKAIELTSNLSEAFLERGHAAILLEQFDQAELDLAKAIELNPSVALGYAYRALMYKKLGQPELGAQEVGKAMVLDKNNANVLWAKGEIEESMSRPEEAADAYRKALAIEPQMQNAIYGLKRLGESVEDDTEELPVLSFGDWRVYGARAQFSAVNAELGSLRVPLEVAGEGAPRILSWEMQNGEFRNFGLLRFSAGKIEIDGKPVDNEFIAIIDTRNQTLRGIEPHRQGKQVSKWSWGSGRVIVAAIDGLTQEYVLRRKAQSVSQAQRAVRRRRTSSGSPAWAPWSQNESVGRRASTRRARSRSRQRRRRKPKTLFDLLLGN